MKIIKLFLIAIISLSVLTGCEDLDEFLEEEYEEDDADFEDDEEEIEEDADFEDDEEDFDDLDTYEDDEDEEEIEEADDDEVSDEDEDTESEARLDLSAEASGYTMGKFNTTDIYGNPVDNSIFADKDVTMINVWGTYCPPCIREMPELADMYHNLPENAGIIGIVCDVNMGGNSKEAIEIVEYTGADYIHLEASEDLYPLLQSVHAIPTTFFVDSKGNILGDPIVSAKPGEYRKRFKKYLGIEL